MEHEEAPFDIIPPPCFKPPEGAGLGVALSSLKFLQRAHDQKAAALKEARGFALDQDRWISWPKRFSSHFLIDVFNNLVHTITANKNAAAELEKKVVVLEAEVKALQSREVRLGRSEAGRSVSPAVVSTRRKQSSANLGVCASCCVIRRLRRSRR